MVRVHRHWLEIAFALLAFVQSVSARARDKPVPVTFGKDDRRIADTKGSPWDAVGRVNSSITANSNSYSYNFCSGTLIAPDVVATMAPCVAYLRNKPEKLHFVTGDLRGEYQETVSVKCVFLSKAGGFDDGLFDVALLVLARKLRATPLALSAETEFVPGTPVSHAGYGGDRPFVLSMHENCSVRFVTNDGQIVTDCDMALGQAGGPILVRKADAWQVAGLMAWADEQQGSGGPLASSWRRLLKHASCE
jgi:protease YdgD